MATATGGKAFALSKNKNLHRAKSHKNDEFYTQLADIEAELQHYTEQFRGKVVYCNCDDPTMSNFYRYFKENFAVLGLKELIATGYVDQQATLFEGKPRKAIGVRFDGQHERPVYKK